MTIALIAICIAALAGCVFYLRLELIDLERRFNAYQNTRAREDRFGYLRYDGCYGWRSRNLLKDFKALCKHLGVKPMTRDDLEPVEIVKDPFKGEDRTND